MRWTLRAGSVSPNGVVSFWLCRSGGYNLGAYLWPVSDVEVEEWRCFEVAKGVTCIITAPKTAGRTYRSENQRLSRAGIHYNLSQTGEMREEKGHAPSMCKYHMNNIANHAKKEFQYSSS